MGSKIGDARGTPRVWGKSRAYSWLSFVSQLLMVVTSGGPGIPRRSESRDNSGMEGK